MPKSTMAPKRWLALAGGSLLLSLPLAADSLSDVQVRTACAIAHAQPDVQVVCPNQSLPMPPGPQTCDSPQPNTWRPGCPLRNLHVLAAEHGLAKGSMVVAFKEYPELTNANYQALTPQVDVGATTQELCDGHKGQWVPSDDGGFECRVRPRVRIEPKTLAADTCEWCCGNYVDAIWKGQAEGPNAGCMVPSYVYHRGLVGNENVSSGDKLLDLPARLRSYGFMNGTLPDACLADPTGCGQLDFGFPGWIILLRKGSEPKPEPHGLQPNDGDRLELSLYNLLPPDEYRDEGCNPQTQPHPNDEYPACFHGNDVTNLHFHGSHVSPQVHQDDVLVNVKPRGSLDHDGHDPDAVFFGRYDIALDPITWRQSEGTHWYHPHKHGSTALQVLNGMAGPLIIKGPFDDWIEERAFGAAPGQYKSSLAPQDKVLVVQAIADEINLSARFDRWNTPWAMVNGQFQPTIRMQPGEVQRWRLIGATQDASAHLELFLQGNGLEVRQIAQDGVQFSPESYAQSAIRNPDDYWQLAPGNRIDLLVRASTDPAVAGKPLMMMQRPNRRLPPQALHRLIGDSHAVFPLFQVAICDPREPSQSPCVVQKMTLPELPPLPSYLYDVADSEIVRRRTITFDQTADPAGASRDGAPAEKAVAKFVIDGKPYDPGCVNQTMTIGTAEEWRIVNNTVMNHPLHVHVNPFQITATNSAVLLDPPAQNRYHFENGPIPHRIWRDTSALPNAVTASCVDGMGSPVPRILDSQTCLEQGFVPPRRDDGSLLPIGNIPGEITLRQRFEDFTGPYVLHCHILGHEDRGMMQNLQAVCPNSKYGRPANYGPDFSSEKDPVRGLECTGPDFNKPRPLCAPTAPLRLGRAGGAGVRPR